MGKMMQTDNVRKQLCRFATGVSVLGITKGNFSKIKYSKPSLAEQQRIADFLSVFDEKILGLSRKKALLEDYKKGVMQKLFSQQIRFTNKNNIPFPNWKEKKLGEVAFTSTGDSNREDSKLNGRYSFFDRSMDIRKSERYLFDGEAVIIAGEGQSFPPKYFVGKFDLHQRTYAIMQFKGIVGKFLYYTLNKYSNYFLSQAVGSTVKSLRLPIFDKMPVLLPCLEEQQKIADFLTAIDQKITHATERLEKVKSFKKALLGQMFI